MTTTATTSMNDYLTSSITYSVLPPLLTSSIQNILYSYNLISPQPAQSQQFQRDRRNIHTILIVAYLSYTIYTAYTGLPPTYYDVLGVNTTVSSSELRSRFKVLYFLKFESTDGLQIKDVASRQIPQRGRRVFGSQTCLSDSPGSN